MNQPERCAINDKPALGLPEIGPLDIELLILVSETLITVSDDQDQRFITPAINLRELNNKPMIWIWRDVDLCLGHPLPPVRRVVARG